MSTTGKISQFTSAPTEYFSLRILSGGLFLIQPFTDIGFGPEEVEHNESEANRDQGGLWAIDGKSDRKAAKNANRK